VVSSSVSQRTTTVVLVDDQADLLLLMGKILSSNGFEIAGTAEDGRTGVELVAATQPDVVVLDLAMPHLTGEEALPEIIREAPRTMVAIFSAHLDTDRARQLLLKGAFAAYEKGDVAQLPDLLLDDLDVFRRVMDGEEAVPAWQHRYRQH
jgi:two-component system, chemotaxis family, chemotaxis protein CheY